MTSEISIYKVQLLKVGCVSFENQAVSSPDDAKEVCETFLRSQYGGGLPDREHFGALWLNTKNRVTGLELVSIGSLSAAIVTVRECFKGAILHNAASMIVFHQHPSGDPTPSPEDIALTKRLVEAGELIGIDLLDHIILGEDSYVSLKRQGLI